MTPDKVFEGSEQHNVTERLNGLVIFGQRLNILFIGGKRLNQSK